MTTSNPEPTNYAGGDGVEFGGQMSLDQYVQQSQAAAAADADTDAQPAADPVEDDTPALAGMAAEFGASNDDVDLSGMPEFRSLKGMLPSGRMRVQMDLVKIATALPETFAGETTQSEIMDLDPAEFDALAGAIENMENAVLRGAVDKDAMAEWLSGHDSPMAALMGAFNRYAEYVGK